VQLFFTSSDRSSCGKGRTGEKSNQRGYYIFYILNIFFNFFIFTDGKIRVLVTHVNGLDSFYVQKYSSLTHIQAMTASIDSKKKQLINHEDLRIGT
jgi:hypothetical protein